jgi:cell division protein FtsB
VKLPDLGGRLPNPRRVGTVAMIVLASGLAIFGAKESVRTWQMRRALDTVDRELNTLRARQTELSRTVDRLRNDPAYIEQIAREQMGMVREGESVLKFPSHSPPAR